MPSHSLIFRQNEAQGAEQEKKPESELPLLSLITFQELGNPLESLQREQRRFFLESVLRRIHLQKAEDIERSKNISRSLSPIAGASAAAIAGSKLPRIISVKKEADMAQGQRAEADKRTEQEKRTLQEERMQQRQAVSMQASTSLQHAQHGLSLVLDDYARGDMEKAGAALSEFESRLQSQNFKADDLMAVLLLVIEDQIWEGEEGKPSGARPGGLGMKMQRLVPAKLREVAKDSAEVRLASVREMLRYYFKAHPKEYASALASALSITSDQEGDQEFLQERLASELARIGGFALAQKLLADIKRKKKMDTKKCMLELGYRYDARKKKLIIGKRTCGKPAEAKGIIGLLLAAATRKEDG